MSKWSPIFLSMDDILNGSYLMNISIQKQFHLRFHIRKAVHQILWVADKYSHISLIQLGRYSNLQTKLVQPSYQGGLYN